MKLAGCIPLCLFAMLSITPSLLADSLDVNLAFTATVSTMGTCQPDCGPNGFDLEHGDLIVGSFGYDWISGPGAGGYFSATFGSESFTVPAGFGWWGPLGNTRFVLLQAASPDHSFGITIFLPVGTTFGLDELGCTPFVEICSSFPNSPDYFRFGGILEFRGGSTFPPLIDPILPAFGAAYYLNAVIDPRTGLTPIPEPSTWLLLGSGMVGLIAYRKLRTSGKRLS